MKMHIGRESLFSSLWYMESWSGDLGVWGAYQGSLSDSEEEAGALKIPDSISTAASALFKFFHPLLASALLGRHAGCLLRHGKGESNLGEIWGVAALQEVIHLRCLSSQGSALGRNLGLTLRCRVQ